MFYPESNIINALVYFDIHFYKVKSTPKLSINYPQLMIIYRYYVKTITLYWIFSNNWFSSIVP